MLGTFILGAAAGWGAPYAEAKIKGLLEGVLLDKSPVPAAEMRIISFAVCLVVAAVLSMLIAEPHAAALALGAAIGVFAPRFLDKSRADRTPDYDS